MRLRDGLLFHDGKGARARLRRLAPPLDGARPDRPDHRGAARSLEARDDRTLVWRLRKPFASLPYALAKTQPSPVIMPARLAATDPYKQVPESSAPARSAGRRTSTCRAAEPSFRVRPLSPAR